MNKTGRWAAFVAVWAVVGTSAGLASQLVALCVLAAAVVVSFLLAWGLKEKGE